jgi:hypothetical protein
MYSRDGQLLWPGSHIGGSLSTFNGQHALADENFIQQINPYRPIHLRCSMTRYSHTHSPRWFPVKKVEKTWHDQFSSCTLPSNGTTYQLTKHGYQVGTWTQGAQNIVWKYVHSANGGTDPTNRPEIFPRALGWDSQLSHDIASASPHLPYHNCNYGIFSAERPAFTTAAGGARHVSRKRCYGHQHVSASMTSTRIS